MKHPDLPTNPVLVGLQREKTWDAFIRGAVVIVKNKKVVQSLGDVETNFYLRSSEKPLQAVAVVASGAADAFKLTDEEVAIISGSHNGEPIHVDVIKSMLKKGKMDFSYLQCGTHPPNPDFALELYKRGYVPKPQNHNCSGKHSGMLLMCKHLGLPTKNYLDREHPMQKMIKACTAAMCEFPEKKMGVGVDGCGVPVHSMPITNMAIAFENLANPSKAPEKYRAAAERVKRAMAKYPLMTGGHKRFCTDLNALSGKLVAKGGAEGVYCVGLVDKDIAVATKMDDGYHRGWIILIPQILLQLGAITQKEYNGIYEDNIKYFSKNTRGDIIVKIHQYFQAKKLPVGRAKK